MDADQSGVLVTPRESRVFEGQSFAYQVQLYSQPTSNVVVEISASSHLSVSIEYLTFTPENWAQPQTVRVKSLEDNIDFGKMFEALIVHYAISEDKTFTARLQ